MDVKNLANQSSFTSTLLPKLAIGVGAIALLSTVLTFLEFIKEELPIEDMEPILNEQDNTRSLN